MLKITVNGVDYNLPLEKVNTAIFIDKFKHNKIIFVNGAISNIDLSYEDETKVFSSRNLDFNESYNETNPLISLNNAFASSYIGITVKEGYSFKFPLIIYKITNNSLKSTALNIRTDIILEKNSNLKLITLFDDSSGGNFINIVQNFDIAKDAILKNYKVDHKLNSNEVKSLLSKTYKSFQAVAAFRSTRVNFDVDPY